MLAVVVPLLHCAFVAVLVGGAFLVWRHPSWWKVHLPAVVAMMAVTSVGADCPLTVWENDFRERAGWDRYDTGFISHYFVEPWHPAGITPSIRAAIIAIWIIPNVIAYSAVIWWVFHRRTAHPA